MSQGITRFALIERYAAFQIFVKGLVIRTVTTIRHTHHAHIFVQVGAIIGTSGTTLTVFHTSRALNRAQIISPP